MLCAAFAASFAASPAKAQSPRSPDAPSAARESPTEHDAGADTPPERDADSETPAGHDPEGHTPPHHEAAVETPPEHEGDVEGDQVLGVEDGEVTLVDEEEAEAAAADESESALQWDEDWRPVSWPALISTATLGSGVLLTRRFLKRRETTRFTNANRLDLALRGIRLRERGGHRVELASDFTRYSVMLWPVVDAIMLAAIDRNPEVGAQLMLMNMQSMALTGFLVRFSKNLAGRQRPFETDCDPAREECTATGASFFSGHTATAFTGAGLVCVQHRHLDIYGGGAADRAACGMALTASVATGLFRMMADRHWVTDVMVGATVGLLSGWLLPRLLYFRSGEDEDFIHRRMRRGVVAPFADRETAGLIYSRIF